MNNEGNVFLKKAPFGFNLLIPLVETLQTLLLIWCDAAQSYFFFLNQVKQVNFVESDPKALFSIATTPRCKGGRYSFPWIALLYP